jgi:hypothetical protein
MASTGRWRNGRRVLCVLALAVLALGLTTSQPPVTARGSALASSVSSTAGIDSTARGNATPGDDPSCAAGAALPALGPTACRVQITPDGGAYDYGVPSSGGVSMTAPATSGTNNREFFWSSTSPVESDASACATFESGHGQPGIALRIGQPSNPDRTVGVTVLENFDFSVFDVFDFDVWDSSKPLAFALFGQTTISALPTHPPTLPLHMCARAIGRTVQFVVWETGMTRPPWGDPTWGGQAELPPGAPSSGQSGFYVGHIEPGTSVTYDGLTVDGVRNNPLS